MENNNDRVLAKNRFMKKGILVAVTLLTGLVLVAQQQKEKPPPPPKVLDVKVPPPAPPRVPISKQNSWLKDEEAFLKNNPPVKSIGWSENKITLHLKSGKEEVFEVNNKEQMDNFRKQYGELPEPPPPPPPPPPPAKPTAPKKVDYPKDYTDFLNRNLDVKSIGWSEEKIRIRLKSGMHEEYDLNNKEQMEQVKNKYGELPAPPPKLIKVEKK
jgi:hypothetical protein